MPDWPGNSVRAAQQIARGEPMDKAEIIDAREYFARIGVWPAVPSEAKPKQWLANFLPSEKDHALALLDAFTFFNAATTTKLFTAAFKGIAAELVADEVGYSSKRNKWTAFLDRVIITHPTGEAPNTTDSGHAFARLARQKFGVEETHTLTPELAIVASQRMVDAPVVFVDDFGGSGDQFLKTWRRKYRVSAGEVLSFAELAATNLGAQYIYCPAVTTSCAVRRIAQEAPEVRVVASHVLPEQASVIHPDNPMIPDELKPDLMRVIIDASHRAGVEPSHAVGPFGYFRLGLAIAFEHSVPDATLPIFWKPAPAWTPLYRRR